MANEVEGLVGLAIAEASTIRIDDGIPVRVFERNGRAVWSKVDDEMNDLTAENSTGMLHHVRSIYAAHGQMDAITALQAEVERARGLLREARRALAVQPHPLTADRAADKEAFLARIDKELSHEG